MTLETWALALMLAKAPLGGRVPRRRVARAHEGLGAFLARAKVRDVGTSRGRIVKSWTIDDFVLYGLLTLVVVGTLLAKHC